MIDKKLSKDKNKGLGCAITLLILAAIIFIPLIINTISDSIESDKEARHEVQLIEEGKTKSASDVINEIMEILKNRDETKLEEYLAENFIYSDNDNNQSKYIDNFLSDLSIYSSSYEIERRGNEIQDKETYRIYWNIVEENRDNGVDKTSQYYCLQKITMMLKRVIKEDIITYEIEKIILTDN